MTHDEAFEILLKDGTIYKPPKDAIFDFVDAFLKRQERVFDLLDQCYKVGESTLALISVLYTNAKQVLQVQSCKGDAEKSTGMTAWQVKCAREKSGRFSNGELVRLMKLCQEVEKNIKIGQIDEQIAMDFIISKVL